MRRAWKAAAVLLVSTVLSLGAVEAGLAWYAPVAYQRPLSLDPNLAWSRLHRGGTLPGLAFELSPNAEVEVGAWRTTVHTNSEGLRGPEVERRKPEGVVRIACVGDSFTFGHGVPDEASFPSQLQAQLDGMYGGGRYEVLNFGVSGYSSHEEAIVVRHKALAFDPDVIVLGYVLNDPEIRANQPLHRAYFPPLWWQRFNLTRWVAKRLEERRIARYGGWFRYLHMDRSHWRNVVEAFRDIRESTADRGVPVLLVLMPLVDQRVWEPYPQAPLHAKVARAARQAGFRVLDLRLPLSERVGSPRDLRLENDAHANPEGNRQFARAILEELQIAYPHLFEGAASGSTPPGSSPDR